MPMDTSDAWAQLQMPHSKMVLCESWVKARDATRHPSGSNRDKIIKPQIQRSLDQQPSRAKIMGRTAGAEMEADVSLFQQEIDVTWKRNEKVC